MSREGPPVPAGVLYDQQPSDVTLVKNILGPWVATGVNKAGEAHVVDIYSAEPDELARRFQATISEDGERIWYFLSRLRSKGPSGWHKSRAVVPEAAGRWHTEAASKNIIDPLDGGRLVGYAQKLSFVRKGADGARVGVRTGWVMTEFHLHQYDDEGGAGRKIEGLVLCKVYRSNRRRDPAVTPGHDARGGAAKKYGDDDETEVGATTAAAAAPLLNKKYDDGGETEVGATTAAAAALGPKPADDKALPPARKRVAAADDKALLPARKRVAADAGHRHPNRLLRR